ncbi:predicted protein [Sclerotinia sclerotiorum 1980 UF-70]|uniref:Uncharacterized protein n=2 Tax=Sclerotinia sclerotiorum (strain ATCC 18683 / 1980 / Ss-1) TaxID=665079 RepID=A0A1D9QMC6_SCLS1|nr:predicted protein [Sclerotinia sclerotiorum 1980 UF-70]APA16080.1 hypothetical protein sscle_16g108500 [Sclerotinia sclerotiorum 1980 UF-70]EDN94341.1 predicted protein [Sclerotinia sclerotiorum 1980 UF-70]
MEQTTARLRKTFRYPTDSDSDDSLPEALDEEEQDKLIQHLAVLHTKYNTVYARLLLCLPLISIIPYLLTLFSPATSLLSILSITSLLSTAFLVYSLPPEKTSITILDNFNQPSQDAPLSKTGGVLGVNRVDDGPLLTYLPTLNLLLSFILGVLGTIVKSKHRSSSRITDVETDIWWTGFEWLPFGIYAVVLLAKTVMGSVNPEEELGGLRYRYKGA